MANIMPRNTMGQGEVEMYFRLRSCFDLRAIPS